MSYENLATKYRPKNLGEVLGQETIKTTLYNAVKFNRLAHSYIFYGPRGCGKTTIARILAKTINCPDAVDGKPCDKCPSCIEIAESKSMDVLEIDAASHTDVDNVRSVIIENVGFAPSRDKYKIYILDEVHMLSKTSFNALLKTVEEPPAHVVFIMATTEQTKVPVTILSRSQCFRFRPISEELIASRLREVVDLEKMKASDEALASIAKSAGGAMRDALTLLDRAASFGKGVVETEALNELLGHAGPELIRDLSHALIKRDAAGLYAGFEKIELEGYDPLTLVKDLRNALAETFLTVQGFSKMPSILMPLPAGFTPITLAKLSRKLNTVIDEIKFSDTPALSAEIALFTLIETPQDLDGLVRRLEALEGRSVLGTPPPGGPAGRPGISDSISALPASQERQKKNSGLILPAPKPEPAQPLPEEPAAESRLPAGVSPDLPPSAIWKKLLGVVSAKKPMLYNVLLSTKIIFEKESGSPELSRWTLAAANKFEAQLVEKAKPELEEILLRVSGRKIELKAEHNPSVQNTQAEPVLETLDVTEPEPPLAQQTASGSPETPAQAKWQDIGPDKPFEEEPEFKHLNKVFHGRITRVKKIKWEHDL